MSGDKPEADKLLERADEWLARPDIMEESGYRIIRDMAAYIAKTKPDAEAPFYTTNTKLIEDM